MSLRPFRFTDNRAALTSLNATVMRYAGFNDAIRGNPRKCGDDDYLMGYERGERERATRRGGVRPGKRP